MSLIGVGLGEKSFAGFYYPKSSFEKNNWLSGCALSILFCFIDLRSFPSDRVVGDSSTGCYFNAEDTRPARTMTHEFRTRLHM